MAKVVRRDRNLPIDWGAVAIVRQSLQTIIDAHGVETDWLLEPLEGGWLREVEIELDTGGLAYFDEHRQYPDEFTVNLQRHRDMFFFKEDYAEVLAFLNVDSTSVTLLTGQVRWWKKKRPTKAADNSRAQDKRPGPAGKSDA